MDELSVLIGGKAGFGIDKSSLILAGIMGRLGYRLYIYRDYPSIIRGGHTFSVIRASKEKIAAHKDKIDVLLAMNQDTVDIHKDRLKAGAAVIYDADAVKQVSLPAGVKATALPMLQILKEEGAGEIMRNAGIVGAFSKAFGIGWAVTEQVFRKSFEADASQNLKVARRGYDAAVACDTLNAIPAEKMPLLTGNEAVSLGLIQGGLKSYISYPMTPTSPILHFMAKVADTFDLTVVHPESEIAVIMMALGMAYCGERVAVGTSGGGFCLMTEGLSLSGMAELPVVIVMGQRPGPSTGLPTYSCQTELQFVMSAGQGEFLRLVVAPGDAEEAYAAAQLALDVSWKYQIPAILLTDKLMGEGAYSFDKNLVKKSKELTGAAWSGQGEYKRYQDTDAGVSPMAFPSDKGAVVKVNSYEHDEYGITTEKPDITTKMQNKRLRKEKELKTDLEQCECVKIYGNKKSPVAILCWGSNKGVCVEVAQDLGIKVIQPLVLMPFPAAQFKRALEGVTKLIAVESNALGQLAKLIAEHGFGVQDAVLKYDGRPFGIEELEERIRGIVL